MPTWSFRFQLGQYVRTSLWILPVLGLAAGTLLGEAALALDDRVGIPTGWRYTATTATGVLTAIVGAMVALLGFVVTIGVLAVQQAIGTLSPRYMRLWYRNPLQKTVLSLFAGTFAFAFTLLRRIGPGTVPDLGVTLAGLAVAVSLVMLLVYLNRFVHDVRPVAIADRARRTGLRVLGVSVEAQGRCLLLDERADDPRRDAPAQVVRSEDGGAVQGLDVAGLVRAASRYDCVLAVAHCVGDFVPPGAVLLEVHGTPRTAVDPRRLSGLVALGAERTAEQAPAFALRVLADIAARALSSAVNDPTTAVQVLNHIEAFLHAVGRSELRGRHVLADRDGRPRAVVPGRGWEEYLELGVTEVREYGVGSLQVCRRLRALLDGLLAGVPDGRRPAVRRQLALLDDAVEREYPEGVRRTLARTGDRQGIGGGGSSPGDAPRPGGDV
ncbi:putative membrane protein [Streptomyces albogriseolus]